MEAGRGSERIDNGHGDERRRGRIQEDYVVFMQMAIKFVQMNFAMEAEGGFKGTG